MAQYSVFGGGAGALGIGLWFVSTDMAEVAAPESSEYFRIGTGSVRIMAEAATATATGNEPIDITQTGDPTISVPNAATATASVGEPTPKVTVFPAASVATASVTTPAPGVTMRPPPADAYAGHDIPLNYAVTDDFNRANEDPLSQGGQWIAGSIDALDMVLVSNQVTSTSSATAYAGRRRSAAFGVNQEAGFRLGNRHPAGDENYLILHGTGGSGTLTGYVLLIGLDTASPPHCRVQRVVNGNLSTIVIDDFEYPTHDGDGTNDHWALRSIGEYLQLWYKPSLDGTAVGKWRLLATAEDETYRDGTPGLGMIDNDNRLDDFYATTLSLWTGVSITANPSFAEAFTDAPIPGVEVRVLPPAAAATASAPTPTDVGPPTIDATVVVPNAAEARAYSGHSGGVGLSDNFNDNSLAGNWDSDVSGFGATLTEQNQRLELEITSGAGYNSVDVFTTERHYLAAGPLVLKVADTEESGDVFWDVEYFVGPGVYAGFSYNGGDFLAFYSDLPAGVSNDNEIISLPAEPFWLRLRLDAGTLRWETSSDGSSWSEVHSRVAGGRFYSYGQFAAYLDGTNVDAHLYIDQVEMGVGQYSHIPEVRILPGSATATASGPTPTPEVRVFPAAADATASAPTPSLRKDPMVVTPAAAATASGPAPVPEARVLPGSAVATASAPAPVPEVRVAPAAAAATASAGTPSLRKDPMVTAPPAIATASAPSPDDLVTVQAPAAAATASAGTPVPEVKVLPDAAAATASAASPTPEVRVLPGAATATASAPTPAVTTTAGKTVFAEAASATASAPAPTPAVTVAPAAAAAQASGPTPTPEIRIAPSAAAATSSAGSPVPEVRVHPGAASGTTSAPTPTPRVDDTVQAPPAIANASAPTPDPEATTVIQPPAAGATASGSSPTPLIRVFPGAAAANASAPTPDVIASVDATVLATAAAAAGSAEAPLPKITVLPSVAEIMASAGAPVIALDRAVQATVASLLAGAPAPIPEIRILTPAAPATAFAPAPVVSFQNRYAESVGAGVSGWAETAGVGAPGYSGVSGEGTQGRGSSSGPAKGAGRYGESAGSGPGGYSESG